MSNALNRVHLAMERHEALPNKQRKKKTDCQYRCSPKMLCVCICFIQLFLKHDLALKMFTGEHVLALFYFE